MTDFSRTIKSDYFIPIKSRFPEGFIKVRESKRSDLPTPEASPDFYSGPVVEDKEDREYRDYLNSQKLMSDQEIIQALKGEDVGKQSKAIISLKKLDLEITQEDPDLVDALVAALKSKDKFVLDGAANALNRILHGFGDQ
ncbi:MAG: HEAT repeat domain-containing protein [Deltaproteobacteria bacterium]|nr:HEAT repeat domain-containing protein [Deltaproteobacteria bacterium]